MALLEKEIVPGVVAYFAIAALSSEGVRKPAEAPQRDGPFVCVQEKGGQSVWAPLTTGCRVERLKLQDAWRQGGPPRWRTQPCYLLDGAMSYAGPNSVFVAAAAGERPFPGGSRPYVMPEGVTALVEAVKAKGGHLALP